MGSVGRAYSLENRNRYYKHNSTTDEYKHVWKVITIGESGVGKSSLMSRYVNNAFPDESVKCNLVVQVESTPIKLQIWDTIGQERFRSITRTYYRGAKGVLLVYDISKHASYERIPDWLKEMRESDSLDQNAVIILVGNKTDLEQSRAVPTEEAKAYADDNGLLFVETSALNSSNVETAFQNLCKEMFENYKRNNPNEDHSIDGQLSKKTSWNPCCGV